MFSKLSTLSIMVSNFSRLHYFQQILSLVWLITWWGLLGFPSSNHCSKLTRRWRASGKKNVDDFHFAENAHSVVTLLKQYGFDETHVRKLVCFEPRFLTAKIDKTLKPKLHLLHDLGFSGPHLVNLVLGNPVLLRQRLGPAIQALRDVMGSDDKVASVVKQSRWAGLHYVTKNLRANAAVLENEYGIPPEIFRKHIVRKLSLYVGSSESFRGFCDKAGNKLGIPRHSPMFTYGIDIAALSDKNFESKCQVFKSFGWTESDVMQLIRVHPSCLKCAAERIKNSLQVLMNDLGYEPADLVSCPTFLTYSTDKRILPRHRILLALKERGLICKDYPLRSCIRVTDARFLERFVRPYTEVHEVYAKETGCSVKVSTQAAEDIA